MAIPNLPQALQPLAIYLNIRIKITVFLNTVGKQKNSEEFYVGMAITTSLHEENAVRKNKG